MTEFACPRCHHEFEIETWENGVCPQCGNDYWWEDFVSEDYSESWAELWWEDYKPLLLADGPAGEAPGPGQAAEQVREGCSEDRQRVHGGRDGPDPPETPKEIT